jgi:radical SAM superfamily enzyme YgiQ (UPF0313 family)
MKVLLIQAYLGRKDKEGNIFPLGLCYIGTALADRGHEIALFDPNLYDDPYMEIERISRNFMPEVVGISLRNIDTTQKLDKFCYYKTLNPTVAIVKKALPGVRVMIGGTGFSMFAEQIMAKIPEIDFGVFLEGDESTPELLDNLERPETVKGLFVRMGDRVIFTGSRSLPDMDRVAMPRKDFAEVNKYIHDIFFNIGIQTKRGCSLKCAYCSYPFLNGVRLRLRSPERVVDEIENLINRYGIHQFMFADSVFNLPRGHAEAICREILKRKIRVSWNAWFDIRNFTEELMYLAKDAGCVSMAFSPDAASNASLRTLRKSITEHDIYRVLSMVRKVKGIHFFFSFFCTPPAQDFIGFLKMLKLFFVINIFLLGKGRAGMGWIRVEPNTLMSRIAIADGLIDENTGLLPETEEELDHLFYSCPTTRRYADPIFLMINQSVQSLLPLLRIVKKSFKGKKKDGKDICHRS